MSNLSQIVADIKKGVFSPVYFLCGEEPYYIDEITDLIEAKALTEDEKAFNQTVVYGKDVVIDDLISTAKRFPMMAERQVVIVREAQHILSKVAQLESYVENPMQSTVLVFCCKYKKLDARTKFAKIVKKTGVVFESKKLYENQIPDWIISTLSKAKYQIEPKAAFMLVEFLGNDLSKIKLELKKLSISVPEGTLITPQVIEEHIGISKDFNVFELRGAIGNKDILRANRIANYFGQNPKAHPNVLTIGMLNSFFTQLLTYHGLKDKSKGSVAKALRVNPFFVDDYVTAAKNYPMRKVSQVIGLLREFDLKTKGVGAVSLAPSDVLKEMLFKILH